MYLLICRSDQIEEFSEKNTKTDGIIETISPRAQCQWTKGEGADTLLLGSLKSHMILELNLDGKKACKAEKYDCFKW